MEYMVNNKEVPEQIKGWNWGAFAFNWIWGIRFRTYRALFVFVPLVNIVMPFILGFKGNEWAWKHNHWSSVDEFKSSQRKWSIAAAIMLSCSVIFAIIFTVSMNSSFEVSGSTRLALSTLESSDKFHANIGTPYDIDLIQGTIRGYEVSGSANMQYKIEGLQGDGLFEFKAELRESIWRLTCLEITYLPSQELEIIAPCEKGT
ncbi:cytochrome c oxidase assembly factor Coa1 family protein [Vibrio parahaemolyticus]|nr:cytochrome c oxidase assembly factor Coa1 family protein [Vibrio parahaemolyticus]MDF4264656.1 cytochrome c oxidase assembly factor Coa1 family protein [Vibrio parahaemolyticus]MDF4326594.1 cytochrome c oxidase assembly factor Coa1 family protein [Vibrio parahaemolyticus]MDG2555170.1 cytochrome c oxidase assembly factor Coa1 family protein [Vibrio parahaemolyticus]